MTIEIEETKDFVILNKIIRDPSVYPFISADHSPEPNEYSVKGHVGLPENVFYLVKMHDNLVGCFIFTSGEMHTCLLPDCRGKYAIEAGRKVIIKFEQEHPETITSFAWEEEPRTTWYANKLGFIAIGQSELSTYTRNGKNMTVIRYIKNRLTAMTPSGSLISTNNDL